MQKCSLHVSKISTSTSKDLNANISGIDVSFSSNKILPYCFVNCQRYFEVQVRLSALMRQRTNDLQTENDITALLKKI